MSESVACQEAGNEKCGKIDSWYCGRVLLIVKYIIATIEERIGTRCASFFCIYAAHGICLALKIQDVYFCVYI